MRTIVFTLLLTFLFSEKQIPDSTLKKLDVKLEEYVKALERESAAEKAQECDFILETVTVPAIRDHAARKLYDHYRQSPVMGDEAVAIHLTDQWFTPGKVRFEKEEELFDAQVFADFNRSSQIGMEAPKLNLRTPADTTVVFPAPDGRMKILYFYDTDCASCKLMTPVLVSWLDKNRPEAEVVAVYVGDQAEEWAKGREAFAKAGLPVSHRWDPELDSDFQRLYGLLQTPKLFLINEADIIVGRGLDVPALHLLLFRHHVGSVTAPLVDEGGHVGGES